MPTESKNLGLCGVKDTEKYGPLSLTWDLTTGRDLLVSGLKQVADDHPQRLPAALGSGFVVYSPSTSHLPYAAGSLFHCGSRDPWIYLALRSVTHGRDATKDLTALVRIAEKRFGEVHRCKPG